MSEHETQETTSARNPGGKPLEPRTPRSIRFSASEWASIEREAKERGMNAAELVRHAAVGFATGELSFGFEALPLEITAQIERIYRGVYLLSTLKRDEMIHRGRQEELERIRKDARESQSSIRQAATKSLESGS